MLGLADVELAARAVGLELSPLQRQPLAGQACVVLGLELGDGAGGGRDAGRRDGLEECRGDGLVEPAAAQRLARVGAMQVKAAHTRIARRAPARARIRDLHPPAAAPAAQQALQQRGALARGAAALAARPHVRAQPLARGEEVGPGDIAGMVLGQADGPLLQRQLDGPDFDLAALVDALVGASSAEHERACIRRVGQQVVHGAIAGAGPAHPPLTDPAPRQLLALRDELGDDLARGPQPPPQHEHPLDRVAHLLIGAQDNAPVLVAIQPHREARAQLAAGSLVAQPAVQPGADEVKLGLRHRALQPEQQPVVEVGRRIDAVGVGDQRARQGAQVQQPMPVR